MKYVIYLGVIMMPDKNAAAQRAMAFSSLIASGGYKPIIIGMSPERSSDEDVLQTETPYLDCIYYSLKYPSSVKEWGYTIQSVSEIIKIIKHYGKDNIQAVIAMDYYSIALAKLMRYCKKNKIKFIVDTVDWFAKSQDSFPKNLVKDFDTAFRMRVINKRNSSMITISKYLFDYYRPYVADLIEIPGMIAPTNYEMDYVVDATVKSLVFVGSPGKKCEKEKIDWIIKSVCRLNKDSVKIKFYIAGVDKKTLFENREDIAAIPNFDESIICYGRLPREDCLKLVSKSDFSVIVREDTLLSKAGFPTKLGESFACGTPVLVTPTSNICDYIPLTHGIVADNCSEEALEAAITKIVELTSFEIAEMHDCVKKFNPLCYYHFQDELLNFIRK